MSPSKLAKIYNGSDTCWKCTQKVGTFYHICNKAKLYWYMVKKIPNKSIGQQVNLDSFCH